jgi:hypothetical protein
VTCELSFVFLWEADPAFHADDTIDSVCFAEAIVDIGAKCLKRHFTLMLALCTSDVSPTEATTTLDTYSLLIV